MATQNSRLIRDFFARWRKILVITLAIQFLHLEFVNASSTTCIEGTHYTILSSNPTILKFTNTSDCNFAIPARVSSIEILAVGGGGGGGMDGGSGGGGGELRYADSFSVSSYDSLTVKIGVGGSAGTYVPYVSADTGTATIISGNGVTLFQANPGGAGATWAGSGAGRPGGLGGTSGIGGVGTSGQRGGQAPTASCLTTTVIGESLSAALTPSNSITGTSINYGGGGGGGIANNSRGSHETATVGASGGGTSGGQGASYRLQLNGSPAPRNKGTSRGGDGTANTGGGGGGGGACSAHSNSGALFGVSETWDGVTYTAAQGVDGRAQRTSGGTGADGVVIFRYVQAPLIPEPSPCVAPRIEEVEPNWGDSSGGTRVKIIGQNLSPAVYFEGRLVDVRLSSANSVTVITPGGRKGKIEVRIDGCGSSSKNSFIYDPDPKINSISSEFVSTLGSELILMGDFFGEPTVELDGALVKSINKGSSMLLATLPPHTPGLKILTVRTNYGASTVSLVYVTPPQFTELKMPFIAQGDTVSVRISAEGAFSYSLVGELPMGLTFNSKSGLISGIANREGIFDLEVVAHGKGGSSSKRVTLDVDKPIPKGVSKAIYFSRRGDVVTNYESLVDFIDKVKAIAPRNLAPVVTLRGGGQVDRLRKDSKIVEAIRHEKVVEIFRAEGLDAFSLEKGGEGPKNRVIVEVLWKRS